MSYDYQIDKDQLYFTQCNDTFPNRCPECTLTKILRHCKIYHNFPAVWKHIKQDHKDIPESRLDEIAHVENSVFKAFKWNIFPKWEYSEAIIKPTTTSSFILFDGKPPRIDVLERLRALASLFKGQNSANGGIAEFLGSLGVSIMQKFDIFCMLPSTSKKPSVDAIGFNDDSITFVEFKKSGAKLSSKENKVKKLIEEGKVNYEIVDVNLPDDLTTIREPNESKMISF